MSDKDLMQKIVSLAKRRGFVYPSSEIYGGLANCYDYGPMGTEVLRNIRNLWWKTFIHQRLDMVGLDSQIILHPQTWVASGHVDSFTDPLVEDKVTNKRYRADHLIEDWIKEQNDDQFNDFVVEDLDTQQMTDFIQQHNILSPDGNEVSEAMDFKLLFETKIGAVSSKKSTAYLRGETAQGIFSNFKQVLDSTRVQLPFGVGQIGKSFRNEVTTGQFVFRTLEFEQCEIEYFFDPENEDWKKLFKDWQNQMEEFVVNKLGVNKNNIRWRQHTDKERSHYSKDTWDLDYHFPFGWKELWGIAYRTDYDLKQHIQFSGEKLEYYDQQNNHRFVPHVIEPAAGLNRFFFMTLADAYYEDKQKNRTVLKLSPLIAPYQVAVFPLVKNKPELLEKAQQVFNVISKDYRATWDARGNIGKRYFSQDEIGTPLCITVDYDTLEHDVVTIRDRDTMEQDRVEVAKIDDYIKQKLSK